MLRLAALARRWRKRVFSSGRGSGVGMQALSIVREQVDAIRRGRSTGRQGDFGCKTLKKREIVGFDRKGFGKMSLPMDRIRECLHLAESSLTQEAQETQGSTGNPQTYVFR